MAQKFPFFQEELIGTRGTKGLKQAHVDSILEGLH